MPYFPIKGALTESLKKIHDELSPYIDKKAMRELDNNLNGCFREMRMHIHHAFYYQIAKLIEEGKLADLNEVKE